MTIELIGKDLTSLDINDVYMRARQVGGAIALSGTTVV